MIHFGEQWRFAMSVPVALRTDFTGLQLRALAKQCKDAAFARRLLALAEIFDGGSRSDAARIGGVGLQTIRDWVLRFNAKGPGASRMARHRANLPCSRTSTGAPLPRRSRTAPIQPPTGWCAGG